VNLICSEARYWAPAGSVNANKVIRVMQVRDIRFILEAFKIKDKSKKIKETFNLSTFQPFLQFKGLEV